MASIEETFYYRRREDGVIGFEVVEPSKKGDGSEVKIIYVVNADCCSEKIYLEDGDGREIRVIYQCRD